MSAIQRAQAVAVTIFCTVLWAGPGAVSAQTNPQREAMLRQLLQAYGDLPDLAKQHLSGGVRNTLQLAELMNPPSGRAADALFTGPIAAAAARSAANAGAELQAGPGGTIRVSDPNLDFTLSVLGGFTQSETSTAWCGSTIVVGYNDSGALLRTAGVNNLGGASLVGVSVSSNAGRSFRDLGSMNPGGNPANVLESDPVVTCASARQFYYTSLLATTGPAPTPGGAPSALNAVSVSSSSTGGLSWGPPVIAVAKDASAGHFLDKPWSAVDPSNPQRLYLTYNDNDNSRTSATCGNDFRGAIELVSSADGGRTWSAPVVIDEECGASGNFVEGSTVTVSSSGNVYVGYEFFPLAPPNQIRFVRSLDGGKTFGSSVEVSQVIANGDGVSISDSNPPRLQGGFRNNEFPQIAVDRSASRSRDTIYIVWSDGRNNVVPDLGAPTGTYAYPDILISKSTDLGQSFSAPLTVSPTPAEFAGIGRDQFFPGVAVDRDGHVGVCYYDRRVDPSNTLVDRFCSVSTDGGTHWAEHRVSSSNWLPVHAADLAFNSLYIGDYDALTADFLQSQPGFFGAFEIMTNGNPDVYGKGLRGP